MLALTHLLGLSSHHVKVREKRLHVPLVDRLPEEPPPLIVAVVGPPGVSSLCLATEMQLLIIMSGWEDHPHQVSH